MLCLRPHSLHSTQTAPAHCTTYRQTAPITLSTASVRPQYGLSTEYRLTRSTIGPLATTKLGKKGEAHAEVTFVGQTARRLSAATTCCGATVRSALYARTNGLM
ncbi:hypothetical protein HBI31_239900 [Parastagonospora nodorum]|nr:hypothetical protein HBI31_239900 [Parastagonospora nodorum]